MKKGVKRSNKHDLLKIIGVLSMAIEHIGWVFFPQYSIFQKIGRLAVPIFCSSLALGYKNTSNFKKYFLTVFFFGLISQIPYNLLWSVHKINILIALALALVFIYLVDKKKYFLALIPIYLSSVLFIEYQWYLPVIVLVFYKLSNKKWTALGVLSMMTYFYIQQTGHSIQWYSLIGFVLILFLPEIKTGFKLNKYFFYVFYPLHLLVLWLMRLVF